jgi:hypothetical protein
MLLQWNTTEQHPSQSYKKEMQVEGTSIHTLVTNLTTEENGNEPTVLSKEIYMQFEHVQISRQSNQRFCVH